MSDGKVIDVPGGEAQNLRRVLQRIADVLQCPISDLFGPEPETDTAFGGLAELTRLWGAVSGRQGRQRILAVARQEAARGGDPSESV